MLKHRRCFLSLFFSLSFLTRTQNGVKNPKFYENARGFWELSIETQRGNYLKAEEETTESECDSLESNLKKTGEERERHAEETFTEIYSRQCFKFTWELMQNSCIHVPFSEMEFGKYVWGHEIWNWWNSNRFVRVIQCRWNVGLEKPENFYDLGLQSIDTKKVSRERRIDWTVKLACCRYLSSPSPAIDLKVDGDDVIK